MLLVASCANSTQVLTSSQPAPYSGSESSRTETSYNEVFRFELVLMKEYTRNVRHRFFGIKKTDGTEKTKAGEI